MGTVEHGRDRRAGQRSALGLVLAANAALMLGELASAVAFHSLALVADAVHRLSDVSGLIIALVALRLIERPATGRHSFGLQRAEVLAAQANSLILLGASGWVLYEAVRRMIHPVHVSGGGLLLVASLGLVVSLTSAWVLRRRRADSLNMRAAFLHMAADAAGSLGAMIAGAVILVADVHRADPAASMLISAFVILAGWRLLRDTAHVLLEGVPRGLDLEAVDLALRRAEGVRSVHHLHVWNLASDVPALSAHVVLADALSMHDAQIQGEALKTVLAERFGIEHATLELECHEHEESALP
jgi:cobalt-zinc-cadmium efflux system protein